MSELIQITNYEEIIELLISQYKDSTNLKGILEAALENMNDAELALFEIRDNFYLSTAIGAQLDIIGLIFNVDREGRIDELYREAIQEKATLAYSGEPERIIELAQSIYGATFVEYTPQYPAKYNLYTDAIILSRQLNPINPAGVTGFLLKPILDGMGNYILDGMGRYICAVLEVERVYILDGLGNTIADGNGNIIVSVKLAS